MADAIAMLCDDNGIRDQMDTDLLRMECQDPCGREVSRSDSHFSI